MKPAAVYPTPEHSAAAERFIWFVTTNFEADAVLLVNSCARGKATRDSCLDIVMLARPEKLQSRCAELEKTWAQFAQHDPAIRTFNAVGKFTEVHPDFVDGTFVPPNRDEAAGPDDFELRIGNFLAYSVPLWQSSDYYDRLKAQWLPYYGDELRHQRLTMVRQSCLNNLQHIVPYLERGLYFQAFDRLYNAYREFLQALFIARQTYPIAYNKWIREQVEEILELPALYARLPRLFEIQHFESPEIADKAAALAQLLDDFAPATGS